MARHKDNVLSYSANGFVLSCDFILDHTHSFTDSLAHTLTHSSTDSLCHSFIHSLTHSLTLSLSHSLTHSLSYLLTHSLTHSFMYTLTDSLTDSPIHMLANPYSLTHQLFIFSLGLIICYKNTQYIYP